MTTVLADNPKFELAEHIGTLRRYAKQVLVHDNPLNASEDADRAARVRELMGIGSSFKLTGREIVGLIYAGLLRGKRGCDCPPCRARAALGS